MAFGKKPHFQKEISPGDCTASQYLLLCHEAVKKLGWDLRSFSGDIISAKTPFTWSSWSEIVTVRVEREMVVIRSETAENQLTDWGKNKRNVEELIRTCEDLKKTTNLQWLEVNYSSEQPDNTVALVQDDGQAAQRKMTLISLLTPRENYFITPIIILLNALVFVLMAISGVHIMSPESEDLIKWGASFKPLVADGEWWRIFTCAFIHIGILHLVLNMYAFLYIGVLLEPLLGKTRFIVAYVTTAITSSLLSLVWHDYTVSAGASGAIFGMYGVFLAMLTTNLIEKQQRQQLLSSIGIFILLNLSFGLAGTIDNAGHIGGLLGGIVVGYLYVITLKQPKNKKLMHTIVGLVAISCIAISVGVLSNLKSDFHTYEKAMKRFSENENIAMSIYEVPQDTITEEYISIVQKNGIESWKNNIALLDSLDQLDLSNELKNQNEKLKEYSKLRLRNCELICQLVKENLIIYQIEINSNEKKIEKIIEELNTSE